MVMTCGIERIGALAVPALLAVGITLLTEGTIRRWHRPSCARSASMMAAGLLGALAIHTFNVYSAALIHLPPADLGSGHLLMEGIAVGTTMSALSAALFFLVQRPSIASWRVFLTLPSRAMANVFPATVEEVGFREGVVHVLARLSGTHVALLGGSIPFGLAHVMGRALGQPLVPMHIVGATLAGLLFSAAYLRAGLLFAVGIHWSWNSLARCWADLFALDARDGVRVFEASWTTALVTFGAAVVYAVGLLVGPG